MLSWAYGNIKEEEFSLGASRFSSEEEFLKEALTRQIKAMHGLADQYKKQEQDLFKRSEEFRKRAYLRPHYWVMVQDCIKRAKTANMLYTKMMLQIIEKEKELKLVKFNLASKKE